MYDNNAHIWMQWNTYSCPHRLPKPSPRLLNTIHQLMKFNFLHLLYSLYQLPQAATNQLETYYYTCAGMNSNQLIICLDDNISETGNVDPDLEVFLHFLAVTVT